MRVMNREDAVQGGDVAFIAFREHPELGTCSELAVVYVYRPSKPALP